MPHPHVSVLLNEFLSFFEGQSVRFFVDGTLGAGGHAEAILKNHPEIELFIGIDQDDTALDLSRKRLEPWKDKILLVKGNFGDLEAHLNQAGVNKVDGMLFDLGVSSMQLDRPEKGFSFMHDGALDMRMDPESDLTAEEIVNVWSEHEIARIFRDYGEEKYWRPAARAVVQARAAKPIRTTMDLVNALRPLLAPKYKKKNINPLTLVFQGLRICVNRELEMLENMLPQALKRLAVGGRLAVMTFHSLEDRIAKNIFRYEASDKVDTSGICGLFLDKDPTLKILTRKPVSASDQEIEMNSRSRSAKLRVVEKL